MATIKFLDLHLGNQITWKNHIQLFLRKCSSACFLVMWLCSVKLIYYADFYLIVKYGVIFWSNQQNINKMFTVQKRIVRIMLGLGYRSSCRAWFKRLAILTVPCFIHWRCLWSVIPLTSKLIFLYILYIQGRKIVFIQHWLNLRRYKGALHT